MWSLVKAELSYRWWINLIVFLALVIFNVFNILVAEKTKVIVALSYLSYPAGLFSFIVVAIIEDRIIKENRMAMLARLPLSAKQRAFVRLGPASLLFILIVLVNVLAYLYLGEFRQEVKAWTFISSTAIWGFIIFAWVGLHDTLHTSEYRAGFYLVVIRVFIVLSWVAMILFILSFPDLFQHVLYRSNFAIGSIALAILGYFGTWYSLVVKSNSLG